MSDKLLPCPFCGGEARTFEYDGANQATCGGKHIDCAGTDVVAPVAMWNRRTPAPEGEAWRTVPVEPTSGMMHAFEGARPDNAVQDGEGGWAAPWPDWFRAKYTAMLAASPVVPVGVSREEIARVIEPLTWHRFDRFPPYASDVPHETAVEWCGALQPSLDKADAIMAALRPTDTGRK